MERLQTSALLRHVSQSFLRIHPPFKRPKIAIIDTGYDSGARGLSHRVTKRTNPYYLPGHPLYHWKDFWEEKLSPCDSDGHGTSMLSLIADTAPFADLCVARIAGNSRHLSERPLTTSENLAKVSVSKEYGDSAADRLLRLYGGLSMCNRQT